MRHRDGGYRYLESSGLPVLTQAGEVAGYRGTDRDVTERVQAEHLREQLEEKLRQAQKLKAIGRLAGGIAHDFNNLLTAITGYSELMLARLSADDPRRAEVQEIAAAAERAASLIRRLQAFARKQVRKPELLDLNAVVLETDALLRSLVGEAVELLIAVGRETGRVRADKSQLEQIIVNLAANARDAMPDGGRLSIETGGVDLDAQEASARGLAPGRYVLLVVADTGIGIDAETRPRLFEPFFTTKELGEGAGLGLAAVHGIVAQTAGHVEVESERGHGTTFRIYLPRAAEEAEEKDGGEARAGGGSETILLVEDEEVVRGLSRRVLAASGYAVLEAGTGEKALELAARYEGAIDLVLTDVVMPGMRGPELASRLGSARPGVRVLLTSGYMGEDVVPSGPEKEGAAFLEKPFTPQALLRKVREVLDRDEP
jgi:signal transduction histidine kinase